MKILILLVYYKRPTIVLNALNSIKHSTYKNWELCFIDDSGDEEFKETLFNFGLPIEKVKYVPIFDSVDKKKEMGGVRTGKFMNQCIMESDSDIAIMLCDDDALTHPYLEKLNIFFSKNPNINHCYSHLVFFDPDIENYTESKIEPPKNKLPSDYSLNKYNVPINPAAKVDASQVAWRTKCNKEGNVWFDELRLMNHDEDFYHKLYNKYGVSYYSGFIGQCKGVSEKQLGNRVRLKNKPYDL